jgi:membrane protease YdiL (CAAX protease family)
MTSDRPARATPLRVAAGFVLIFVVYQAAEGLQTVIAPRSPAGPILMLSSLILAWPVGRWLGWRGYDAYLLDRRVASFALLAAGMALALLAKFATLAVALRVGAYVPDGAAPAADIVMPLAIGLLTTFIPSIAEDILTRGFPLRTSGIRWTPAAFIGASALLYTLNHIWRFDWGWTEQVRLFCLGLAYAAAAWRWRTLWAAVALHWGWNFASIVADLVEPVRVVDTDAARLLGAAAHLALLAIVLLVPARQR